jgi:hypothetical protein
MPIINCISTMTQKPVPSEVGGIQEPLWNKNKNVKDEEPKPRTPPLPYLQLAATIVVVADSPVPTLLSVGNCVMVSG